MSWQVRCALTLVVMLSAAASLSTDLRASNSIEALSMAPETGFPMVSPDGSHIAVPQQVQSKDAVVVYNLRGGKGADPFVWSASGMNIDGVFWANDQRLVVSVSAPIKYRREVILSFSRFIAMNKDGSNPVVLFDDSPRLMKRNFNLSSITDVLPNDPDHILMPAFTGARLNLYKVNVNDGKATVVEEGSKKTVRWVTDETGVARGRWDYNDRRRSYALFARTGSKDWDKVVEYGERDEIPELNLVEFTARPNVALVLSNKNTDRMGLYEFDLVSKTLGKLIYQHPRVDVVAPVGQTVDDDTTGRLAGFSYVDDAPRFEFFDTDLKQLQAKLDSTLTQVPRKAPFSWSRDHSVVIVYAEGPRDPGTYYLYDGKAGTIGAFGKANPRIDVNALSDTRRMDYVARDGMKLPGYLTIPKGSSGKNLPLVVYPHGGPAVRDYLQYDPWLQAFAARGYAVFQPNFRGSGGYGKAFYLAGNGEWSLKMQDDITDGVQKLIADGVVDAKRICIVGASYGGYAALAGAMRTPDLYKCAVSISGIGDLEEFLDSAKRIDGSESTIYETWVTRIGDPRANGDRIKAASPALHADQFKGPVLLIHGDKDEIVPVEQSRLMLKALKKAGKDVKYLEIPEEGHGFGAYANRVKVLKEIDDFLAKCLRPAP